MLLSLSYLQDRFTQISSQGIVFVCRKFYGDTFDLIHPTATKQQWVTGNPRKRNAMRKQDDK